MELTHDTLFHGKVVVRQEARGYRFSLDAVLLAGLLHVGAEDRVIDLGTGCGVVPIILASRGQGRDMSGVEIQANLASLAQENVAANGFSDRISIHHADFCRISDHFPAESFDVVVSNPPYRRLESGKINLHSQRAVARHELAGSVADVFVAGKYLLPQKGRLAVIYPATRLVHLMVTAFRKGFSPKELVLIHSRPGEPARLAYLECRRGGGEELHVGPPFFIYQGSGAYTEAMQRLYEA